MTLRETQWLLDDVAFNLLKGQVTLEKREELATILDDLAALVRAAPSVIESAQAPADSPAGQTLRGIKERPWDRAEGHERD